MQGVKVPAESGFCTRKDRNPASSRASPKLRRTSRQVARATSFTRQSREGPDLTEKFFTEQLDNGMVLLGQEMPNVSSAAMAILTPAGAARAPADAPGAAAVGCEWLTRGAGERDTRQLNDALDFLGCRHHEAIRSEHISLSAAQLGSNLPEVLAIYADILRRPRLADETYEPCRALTEQELASLEDEPARKCAVVLRERFYPQPLGRCVYGDAETLAKMTAERTREHLAAGLGPEGTILAVAGSIDWDQICGKASELFGDWRGPADREVPTTPPPAGVTHIQKDSAQTHIGLAHSSVTLASEHYYAARVGEMVLSGGMASRLFTEVREKRGLAYHVSCRYNSLKSCAGMLTYAGTTPPNAQQTFEVTVGELRRLAAGIEDDEMARARTQLKSALVMQGESTEARAAAMANDWYCLGKLRSLAELSDAIDSVTVDDVMAYLAECPAKDFTVLVIGPDPIDTSVANE